MSADKRVPLYHQLKEKWTEKHKALQNALWENHKQSLQFVVGSVSAAVLLATPSATIAPSGQITVPQEAPITPTPSPTPLQIDKKTFLIKDLYDVLPKTVQPLSPSEEDTIAQTLTRHFDIEVRPQLQGIRLNRSYGYIGKEQHLARYSGDTMGSHFATDGEASLHGAEGMAPGLGAYGYFVQPGATLTQKDIEREKYYIAVQTFLSPGYAENTREYNKFFKFHKMLVVNPNNGKAMVVVIGDAGPGKSTGKHLGGSPEVMHYLERVDGGGKGPVLYFFINDPHDTIPLGPVEEK